MDSLTTLEEAIKALPYDCDVTVWAKVNMDVPNGYEEANPINGIDYQRYRKVIRTDLGVANQYIILFIKD